MLKSLDRKLAAIHADPHGCREFILADAKDADMAFGIGAPGRSPEAHTGELRQRTLADYRQQIREITRQGLVDIMLMSSSTSYQLTIQERLFADSHVTPAARANDTTDVHIARGSAYAQSAARPFRSADLDQIQCGHVDCSPLERTLGADLGLYSVTFNNELALDRDTLERYHEFRIEAERKRFRHFLEVFDPNVPGAVDPEVLPHYLNDMIARMLAGVAGPGRPVFLKIVYHGPKALEELVSYDPHLVVGILGGSAGTTRDAFQLLHDAQKYGAKVALYGRKINNSENQLAFVQFLRLIVERAIAPEEAVRAYHAVLQRLGIRPHRPLNEDLQITAQAMSYGGSGGRVTVPSPPVAAPVTPTAAPAPPTSAGGSDARACACGVARSVPPPVAVPGSVQAPAPISRPLESVASGPNSHPTFADGRPDFGRMDVAQRLAYHRHRLGLGR